MLSSSRIEELRTKFEENPRRYFAPLANEYRKAGRIDDAVALCREQLQRYPDHMSGHIVLGQSLYEARSLDDAGRVFETALALDGENLIALRHLGDIARERGQSDVARGWYERVLDADPQHEDVAAQLAALGVPDAAGPRDSANGAQDIELPSFAGALATAIASGGRPPQETAPVADDERPTDGPGAEPAVWEPHSLDDLIERSDDLIVLESTVDETPLVLAPQRLDAEVSLPVDGLEFDPVVGLDEPPEPMERAPLVGFDPSPSSTQLPPLDLHFDDFSAESVRSPHPAPSVFSAAELAAPDDTSGAEFPELGDAPGELPEGTIADSRAFTHGEFEEGPFEELTLGVSADAASSGADETGDEAEATAAPAPAFVTETMAELYLHQGFTQQALDVYRQLSALRPDDDALALRVYAIEAKLASAGAGSEEGPAIDTRAAEELDEPLETTPAAAAAITGAAATADDVDAVRVANEADASPELLEFDVLPLDAEAEAAPVAEPPAIDLEASSPAAMAPADAPATDDAPLSARAFFASLAVRRPTPSSVPLAAEADAAEADAPRSEEAGTPAADDAAGDDPSLDDRDGLPSAEAVAVAQPADEAREGHAEVAAARWDDEPSERTTGETAAELAIPSVHDAHDAHDDRDESVRQAASVDPSVEVTAVAHVAEQVALDEMPRERPTLESLFSSGARSMDDERAAARLSAAFGAGDASAQPLLADAPAAAPVPRTPPPSPATPAESAPRVVPSAPRSPSPAAPAPAAYSFDKFFADDAPATPAAAAIPASAPVAPVPPAAPAATEPPPTSPRTPTAAGDDDIEQFNDWLRGLRDS